MLRNEVIDNMISRRSVRRYRTEQVSFKKLETVIVAGRYAPSGGNSQTNRFLVLQDGKVLQELKELVTKTFSSMEVKEGMYPSIVHSIKASKKGLYDFFFSAPTLIIAANKTDYGNNMADAAAALQNMMLAAHSLDLGSCWINQLRWLRDQPDIRKFLYELGMQEDETVCGALALGYPALELAPPLERKGNSVVYITE